MVALALFGIAAATMTDFDLAAIHADDAARPALLAAEPLHIRSRYLPPKLDDETEASEDGIRVKLRWRRVKLTVPFGPN